MKILLLLFVIFLILISNLFIVCSIKIAKETDEINRKLKIQ